MKIPANIKKYFWEINPGDLKIKKDFYYIIARLLEYGNPMAVQWLLQMYSKRKIKEVARSSRSISKRTKSFWTKI